MANFKFQDFKKGWHFRQQHLVSLDGFNDVNNFVIYKSAIEKVRGWKRLELNPTDSPIDGFGGSTSGFMVIDDYVNIINTMI
jgi:hypothetical protein